MIRTRFTYFQFTELGPLGVYGLDAQSTVEVEPGPDLDLVPIRRLNMEETVVLDPQMKMLIATTILVRVGISTSISLADAIPWSQP